MFFVAFLSAVAFVFTIFAPKPWKLLMLVVALALLAMFLFVLLAPVGL
jgi:hypothetical protein